MTDRIQEVKDYYGKELTKSEDLKTNACCTMEAPPKYIQEALSNIHDEVQAKYYGCGLAIPSKLEGCLLYTSPSPRDKRQSRMPSSA